MADGSVTIDTILSTDKFDRQIASLEKKMKKEEEKKIKKEVEIQGIEQEILNYEEAKQKAIDYGRQLEKLNAKRSEIFKKDPSNFTAPTNEYKAVNQQIEDTKLKIKEQNALIRVQERTIATVDTRLAEAKKQHEEISQEVQNYKTKIEAIKLQKQAAEVDKMKQGFNSVSSSLQEAVGRAGKLALSIFGIRSAYMMLRRASSDLASYDEQYATNLEYIRFVLTQAIAPVLQWIVGMAAKLLQLINAIFQSLFGINIFSNGSADNFKKMKAGASGVGKAVKEIKKQLMGFDEVNVLTADSDTGTGGGAGGGGMPDFDLSLANEKAKAFFNNMKDMWKELGTTMEDILNNPELLKEVFGNWDTAAAGLIWIAKGAYDVFSGLFEGVAGLVKVFVGVFNGDMDLVNEGVKMLADGLWKIVKGLLEMIMGLIVFLLGIIKGVLLDIWDSIKKLLKMIWDGVIAALTWIGEQLIKAGVWVYDNFIKPIGDFFANLWAGIVEIFQNVGTWFGDRFAEARENVKNAFYSIVDFVQSIWNSITGIFSSIGSHIGEVLGAGFKGAVNGALSLVENLLNRPIRAINGVLDIINAVPGISIGYINPINLPRMKTGGIINMPNKGTYVGGAIGGESGREGVIPLTDQQAMADLGREIGKNVLINLTNITEMNGRVISRQLKQVQATQDFAYNT